VTHQFNNTQFRYNRVSVLRAAFIIATFFGLASTIDSYSRLFLRGASIDVRYVLWEFIGCYLWLGILPFILIAVRRFPFVKGKYLYHGIIHFGAAFVVALAHLLIQHLMANILFAFLGHPCPDLRFIQIPLTVFKLMWRIPVYFAIAIGYHSFEYYNRSQREELRTSQLNSALAQARFETLKNRLNPDMLFSAFSKITAMIPVDLKRASEMIISLADDLRLRLARSSPPAIATDPVKRNRDSTFDQQQEHKTDHTFTETPFAMNWSAVLCFWILVSLFFSARLAIAGSAQGDRLSSVNFLLINIPWLICITQTRLIFNFCNRVRLEQERLTRSILLYLIPPVTLWILTLACALLKQFVLRSMKGYSPNEFFVDALSLGLTVHLVIYFAFVFLLKANNYNSRYLRHAVAASELEFQLKSAQLHALKMQLHPHFLFNTLHSLMVLIDENAAAAQKMVYQLKHFLQMTLREITVQKISLEREMDFLLCYLDIEKVRLEDRLRISIEAGDFARRLEVPNLILQPLVENAIKHGMANTSEEIEINIRASVHRDRLKLSVHNNGGGIKNEILKEGIGLSNTRQRLRTLYGESFLFETRNSPTGFEVTIELPVQPTIAHHRRTTQERKLTL
jgi:two-component system, LytTR family, sensor kinase